MTPYFLRSVLVALTSALVLSSVHAADEFKVRLVHEIRSTDLIKVGSAWRVDLQKRLQASLRVNTDTPASSIFVKAYFYDKDNTLVSTSDKPNEIWTNTKKGLESVLLPPTLEKGKDIDVYFALPPELEAKKWKTVLVVFGNKTTVAARSFPASVLPKLTFPESGILIKDTP